MEPKIAILSDSCADVPAEAVARFGVRIIPLHINYENGDYLDRVTIQPEEVYARFATEIPKTSTPSPAEVSAIFDGIAADGFTHVVAVTISSGLSGTHDLVRSVAAGHDELEVAVVDTKSIGIGAGLTTLLACELLDAGKSFEEIVSVCSAAAEQSQVLFCVNTLEYLYKGGRIGKAVYAIGSKLDLRPVITCDKEGKYVVCGKGHGRKSSLKKTLQLARKHADAALKTGREVRFAVAHGDAEAEARQVAEALKGEYPGCGEIHFGQVSPALVVHTGPGLVGVGVSVR